MSVFPQFFLSFSSVFPQLFLGISPVENRIPWPAPQPQPPCFFFVCPSRACRDEAIVSQIWVHFGSVWRHFSSVRLHLAPFRDRFGSVSGRFRGVGWGRGGVGERGFCKGKEYHEAKPGGFQTRGFPTFFGKGQQIVSRTLAGLFLVGALSRPRKRKRTNRENPRTIPEQIGEIPEKSGKSQKGHKKNTKKEGQVQIGKPPPV